MFGDGSSVGTDVGDVSSSCSVHLKWLVVSLSVFISCPAQSRHPSSSAWQCLEQQWWCYFTVHDGRTRRGMCWKKLSWNSRLTCLHWGRCVRKSFCWISTLCLGILSHKTSLVTYCLKTGMFEECKSTHAPRLIWIGFILAVDAVDKMLTKIN